MKYKNIITKARLFISMDILHLEKGGRGGAYSIKGSDNYTSFCILLNTYA